MTYRYPRLAERDYSDGVKDGLRTPGAELNATIKFAANMQPHATGTGSTRLYLAGLVAALVGVSLLPPEG